MSAMPTTRITYKHHSNPKDDHPGSFDFDDLSSAGTGSQEN